MISPLKNSSEKGYAIHLTEERARTFDAMAKQYGYEPNELLELMALEVIEPSRVTMKDVAAVAGVSLMAVSFALNNQMGEVSEQTAKKIKDAAKRLGWRPNIIARSLRRKGASTEPLAPAVIPFPQSKTVG